MGSWPGAIGAITLFVEDLPGARTFYQEVFGLRVRLETEDSAVFDFGNTIVNLLQSASAGELIEPAPVPRAEAGSRTVFTIEVEDVDSMCVELARRGVELLKRADGSPMGTSDGQLP